MLDDFPAGLRAALPDYLRARIGPELACAALAYGHGDGGAAVLARRRAAFVRVYGAGRVGACVATFLAASGVAWVSCLDTGTAAAGGRHAGRARRRRRGDEPGGRGRPRRAPGGAGGAHRRTTPAGCPTWR